MRKSWKREGFSEVNTRNTYLGRRQEAGGQVFLDTFSNTIQYDCRNDQAKSGSHPSKTYRAATVFMQGAILEKPPCTWSHSVLLKAWKPIKYYCYKYNSIKPADKQGHTGILQSPFHTRDSHESNVIWRPRYLPKVLVFLDPGSGDHKLQCAWEWSHGLHTYAMYAILLYGWFKEFLKVYLTSFCISL